MKSPLTLDGDGLTYAIRAGASFTDVAEDLARMGVVENPWYLIFAARRTKTASKIKAGEYRIPPGTTPAGLISLFVAGKVVSHRFTLVEGWTFRELRDALRRQSAVSQTLDGVADDEIMARLGMPERPPEGLFLPETYYFPRGTSDLEILRRSFDAMSRFLARAWAEWDPELPLETPYEALTLASIVEKETGQADERARISGVFVRRLRRGMLLQTDPTIIYGLGEAFDGNLRRRDLRFDTPYNTYLHKGLPPTPIAMPGKDAILATLHPAEGTALYFVAKGDGSHHFSQSLREHSRAVDRYQRRR
jgi:UPF0755 protein